jgi:hypothetical protein
MTRQFVAVCLGLCFATPCWATPHRRFEPLGNPTEYLYSRSVEDVVTQLREIQGPNSWGPLSGVFVEKDQVYRLGVFDHYSSRYWTGPKERSEDVDPPEAGRIGTVQARFVAQVVPSGKQHAMVTVRVETFEQQVGRRFKVFPHFRKVPVFRPITSDSYFEYLFLSKLGELLGEKDMPMIIGSPD